MAVTRTSIQLNSPMPPPSPIPTATGSRSAANETFAQFLEKSRSNKLPRLQLPRPYFQTTTRHPILADIDFQPLSSQGNEYSIDRIVRFSKELETFQISNHGISGGEFESLANEVESVFDNSDGRNCIERNRNRERIVFLRSRRGNIESEPPLVATGRNRNFSLNMENVIGKLEAIAEQLNRVLCENMGEGFMRRIGLEKDYVLSIMRYNRYNSKERNPNLSNQDSRDQRDHALSLHIPLEHCQFLVQSAAGPLSFDAGANTIIAIFGKQIEKWSMGKFKSACAEMVFEANMNGTRAGPAFYIELEFTSSNPEEGLPVQNCKTISIRAQLLIALVFACIFRVLGFLF